MEVREIVRDDHACGIKSRRACPTVCALTAFEVTAAFPIGDRSIECRLLEFRGMKVMACDDPAEEQLGQVAFFPRGNRFRQ